MPKIFRAIVTCIKTSDGNLKEVYDVSDAKRFGELLPPIFPYFYKDKDEEYALKILTKGLRHYHINDFFLVTGDMEMCGMAIGLIILKYGKVKILKWNKPTREYVLREYDLTNYNYESIKEHSNGEK